MTVGGPRRVASRPGEELSWVVIVPVRSPLRGKSRLTSADPALQGIAVPFLLDMLAAVLSCREVEAAVVVSDDVGLMALEAPRLRVLAAPGFVGVNESIEAGARWVERGHRHGMVAALPSDLPALRPQELSAALLAAAVSKSRCFVPDADEEGTAMLAAPRAEPLRPEFGASSAAHHDRSGAVCLPLPLPSLRRDVDTLAALRAAVGLGVGAHTAAFLERREYRTPGRCLPAC
jgi:2-phospho-L-lactate guanylyltransferase